MEKHTVEYSFEAEEASFVAVLAGDLTLYKRPDDTYLVHLDARKGGDNAVLEVGATPRGFSEHDIRVSWPELCEAQSRH
jgi:hypothetical protein